MIELDSKAELDTSLFNTGDFSILGLALLIGKPWCFDLA